MLVALVGYGRMGTEVERVLTGRGHTVSVRVDPAAAEHASAPAVEPRLTNEHLRAADVVIEFAHPRAALKNIRQYADAQCPAVVGTTGWYDHLEEAREAVASASSSVLYGANFSVGAYLFASVARYAASLADRVGAYDVFMHEIHHRMKQDSPSGTALKLAEALLEELSAKRRIVTERLDRAPEPDELHVGSTRGGSVPGTHTVYLDSEADTVTVSHVARTRSGFALGAVLGSEWIVDHTGFHGVETFMNDLLGLEQGR